MTIRAVPTSLSRSARHDYGMGLERAHLFTAVEDILGGAAGLSCKGVDEVFFPHPPDDSAHIRLGMGKHRFVCVLTAWPDQSAESDPQLAERSPGKPPYTHRHYIISLRSSLRSPNEYAALCTL